MSKIKIVNLTEGYLVVNSIQINGNKLSIPPRGEGVVDEEYEEDSHLQELMRMGKIKVSRHNPAEQKAAPAASNKGKKSDKKQVAPEDQDGRKATFMTGKGSAKKTSMVNSVEQQGVPKATDAGPLIDPQEDNEDDKPSEAFVPL